jgi:hypothetical protein
MYVMEISCHPAAVVMAVLALSASKLPGFPDPAL